MIARGDPLRSSGRAFLIVQQAFTLAWKRIHEADDDEAKPKGARRRGDALRAFADERAAGAGGRRGIKTAPGAVPDAEIAAYSFRMA